MNLKTGLKMKKDVKLLLERSINSLILSVEHFNRPWDRGRIESVLILLDHSFELLLKSSILHKNGKIRERGKNETYGFDKCVRISISNKIITKEQALTLQTINGLRDAAQHYMVDISEQQLYMHSQAGLTLFKDILMLTFQKDILDELPERVLPISTTPPLDIDALFENEMSEIKKLLLPGSRKKKEATLKLRSLTIFDRNLRGETFQPSENYLNKLADQVKDSKDWKDLFPGVAAINLTTDGVGTNISLRITKKEGIPVNIVPEDTPGATTVALKTVDTSGYYNLSHTKLAKKVGLTSPRLTALLKHLNLKDDSNCYKEFAFGKVTHPRYSKAAIKKIKEELEIVDMDEIWSKHRPEHLNRMGEIRNEKSKRGKSRKRRY